MINIVVEVKNWINQVTRIDISEKWINELDHVEFRRQRKSREKISRRLRDTEERKSSVTLHMLEFPEGREEIGEERRIQRNSDGKLLRIKKEQRLLIERASTIPRRKDKKNLNFGRLVKFKNIITK